MSMQFVPFEDEWDMLARLGSGALVPYRFEYGHSPAVALKDASAPHFFYRDGVEAAPPVVGQP